MAATLFSMEWRRTKPSNRWKDGYFNHFAANAVLYGWRRRTDYEVDDRRRKRGREEGGKETRRGRGKEERGGKGVKGGRETWGAVKG